MKEIADLMLDIDFILDVQKEALTIVLLQSGFQSGGIVFLRNMETFYCFGKIIVLNKP